MNAEQKYIVEQQVKRLVMTEAQLLDIARAISHNGALFSLVHLTKMQADDLICELKYIESQVAHA